MKKNQGQLERPSSCVLNSVLGIGLLIALLPGCKKDDNSFKLTYNVKPANAGEIIVSPEADGKLPEGTAVSLSTKPAIGYYFSEWTGDATGNDDTLKIIMNHDKEINANFLPGFYEDFEDGKADNFINNSASSWEIKNSAYVVTGTGSNTWKNSYYNLDTFTDFTLSVDLKSVVNNQYSLGVFFRSQSSDPEQNSYKVSIIPTGSWYLIKMVNGSPIWITQWTSSTNLNKGVDVTNHLKIVCSGSLIEIIINGVSQGTYTDTQFASGYAGVDVFDPSGFTNAYSFDNISLKEKITGYVKSTNIQAAKVGNTQGMNPCFLAQ